MVRINGVEASLEYALVIKDRVVALSFFERSYALVKAVAANLSLSQQIEILSFDKRAKYQIGEEWHSYFTQVVAGKEKFTHGYSVDKGIHKLFFITTKERASTDFFHFLMNNYSYPLLEEWKEVLFEEAQKPNLVPEVYGSLLTLEETPYVFGEHVSEERKQELIEGGLCVAWVDVTETKDYTPMKTFLSLLLRQKKVYIAKTPQKPLEFSDMDSYFKEYGHTVVENLQKQIVPLSDYEVGTYSSVLKQIRLFPQQLALVNGAIALLKKSPYTILNMGMGSGKTITSVSMVEGYFNEKFLNQVKGETLESLYGCEEKVSYRNIIMCPGHLVEKWAKEIETQVPYAKVVIINQLEQLDALYRRGKKRTGKEWFVVGKDFCKLSYQMKPVPTKRMRGTVKSRMCTHCQTVHIAMAGDPFVCSCGSQSYQIVPRDVDLEYGMKCPACGELLLSNTGGKKDEWGQVHYALDAKDFANPTKGNERCALCGEALWQPHVTNINTPFTEYYAHAKKGNGWYRATHFANKAKKAKKTVWVQEKYAHLYFAHTQTTPLKTYESSMGGVRKVAPASFISKKLRGYFDFFILDEAHLFKGGATAQGNAMHALVKASKKQLLLTGTIAGGMATHLFYLLYRVDPERMRGYGYTFFDELKFAQKYGTVETLYKAETRLCREDGVYKNVTSKGAKLESPKVKPGISPLIFSDFLLDKTVFLDLSDMSRFLPPLKEEVLEVVPTKEERPIFYHYNQVLTALKTLSKEEGGGVLRSAMLQFALSYLDKPYGVSNVMNVRTGEEVAYVKDFSDTISEQGLLSKEAALVELVNKEQGEGRNVVIYCEYTASPETCITYRLKSILEEHCALKNHEVVVIESTSPEARKREAWMHQKAAEGAKVFIVNPKCVETGCALASA